MSGVSEALFHCSSCCNQLCFSDKVSQKAVEGRGHMPRPMAEGWKTSCPYVTAYVLYRPILEEMKLNPCAKPWLPTQRHSTNSGIYFVNCLRQLYLQSYHSLTPSHPCPHARHGAAVTGMPSTSSKGQVASHLVTEHLQPC